MDALIFLFWMLASFVYSQMDTEADNPRIMEKVFVYGSLKRGEPNHHLLESKGDAAIYISMANTRNAYPLVIASKYNIPYLLNTPGRGLSVNGELYDVNESTMKQLDDLEGHPEYYERQKIPILKNKNETEAWAYMLQDYKPFMDTLPYLESYSNDGSHGLPFVPRSDRVPGDVHSFTEVKTNPEDITAPNNSATFATGSPTKKRHLLFVYGTLKGRERNHGQMTNKNNGLAELIAIANTEDTFPLVIASQYNIPFLLDNQGMGKQVDGEIYMVDDLMLSKIDQFEDYPLLYTRKVISLTHKNTNESMLAWTYLLHDFNTDLLQNELLTTYSSDGPHNLSYQEPEELSDDLFNSLLSELKNNQPNKL